MKIEQFTKIIWNLLVIEGPDHQNHWRVGEDFVQEWSFHTPEFHFMKTFHEKNTENVSDNKNNSKENYRIVRYSAYGRTFSYGIYSVMNTQYINLRRSDLIAIYDHFVDEAQHIKQNRYGAAATPRRPYFMERFNQDQTFLQWLQDPNRIKIL